jgi:cysteine desulfurase
VLEAMVAAARDLYANPASAHALGAGAARALEAAREELAAALEADPGEILFLSGGTEANALGVSGGARAARGKHIVVTALEHPAVSRIARALADEGYTVDVVRPAPNGVVRATDVAAALRPDTAVVAVMLINNELGTVQPVAEIARLLAAGPARRPHFHVDAVQALGSSRVRPRALGADTIAFSAHKLHGPRGAGALWVRPGGRLRPLFVGGGQERGLRGGTENLPALVGFARAATLARGALDGGAAETMAALRDRFEELALEAASPRAPAERGPPRRTVAGVPRAPHIASLAFPGLPAEPLLHALEARAVFASAGSACASRSAGPSPTLQAIGLDEATGVLRFSLSRETTAAEIDAAARAVGEAVGEISGWEPSKASRTLPR